MMRLFIYIHKMFYDLTSTPPAYVTVTVTCINVYQNCNFIISNHNS